MRHLNTGTRQRYGQPMSDTLRDRIAAAVDDFYIYDPCWHPNDWKVAVADAVIRELGLREENIDGAVIKDWVGTPIRIRPPRYRYVTEW